MEIHSNLEHLPPITETSAIQITLEHDFKQVVTKCSDEENREDADSVSPFRFK